MLFADLGGTAHGDRGRRGNANHHKFAYLPFGAGQRICIERSSALMEAILVIAMMSRRYTFEVASGHPVQPEATLAPWSRSGVRMIARRRTA